MEIARLKYYWCHENAGMKIILEARANIERPNGSLSERGILALQEIYFIQLEMYSFLKWIGLLQISK